MKLSLDLSHTAHTGARTGIQRVCRSLHAELAGREMALQALTYDPFQRAWRLLEPWEEHSLSGKTASQKRKTSWPQGARWRGRMRRLLGSSATAIARDTGLIVPELFVTDVARALPSLLARLQGPRVAIFHDAIPLKLPALSPPATTARFPAYLKNLLQFDGVAADSEESRQSLLDYWHWAGWSDHPPVVAMPLGIDLPPPGELPAVSRRPQVLSVGSLEGRKNHPALLAACETLWAEGLDFELHLIGLVQPQTGRAALDQLQRLQAARRPLFYHGSVDDTFLKNAYAACTFTVYPSLMEGFGLPVLESLARGKPCICLGHGALGESARDGGCLALPDVTAPTLAAALRELLTTPETLQRLQTEARARHFRTWKNYADDLLGWMTSLPRRSP